MALKLSPELWVAKYVKSSTNGRVISVRLRRILTLIIIPIWLFGLCITAYYTYNATTAIFKISDAKKDLKSHYQAKAEQMKDPKYLLERDYSGLTHTRDEYAEQQEREINDLQDDELYGIYAIIIYIATCFIIPWVILRLTFWIIDADKGRVESST